MMEPAPETGGRCLVVYPLAGLVNRLRVVACARLLAEETGRQLRINWKRDSDCYAGWEDLFVNPFEPYPRPAEYFRAKGLLCTHRGLNERSGDIAESVKNVQEDVVAIETFEQFTDLAREEFIDRKSAFYRSLSVTEAVRRRIERFARENAGKKLLGVHIRRGDLTTDKGWNPWSVSPTEDFIAACRAGVEEYGAEGIFLATDSPRDEARFRKTFGDKICTQAERDLARNKTVGIQIALADWLLLARTVFIVRSYFSSFSEEACLVHRVGSQTILKQRSKLATLVSNTLYDPDRMARVVVRNIKKRSPLIKP